MITVKNKWIIEIYLRMPMHDSAFDQEKGLLTYFIPVLYFI